MEDLDPADVQRIREAFRSALAGNPPCIGVVGVSGTGKSSTINAMFKTMLDISHTEACTKEFEATPVQLKMHAGSMRGEAVELIVVDAPGLGEDIALDPGYMDAYQRQLAECDVILWVLAARNRAMSLDQQYLTQLIQYKDKMVFGINQVDLVHPMNWTPPSLLPTSEMELNIGRIVADRMEKLSSILKEKIEVIPYSAERGFNLEILFAALLRKIPEDRTFIYGGLKNFSYRDFVPQKWHHLLPPEK